MVAAVFDSLKNENVVVASAEDGGGATKSNADEIDDRIINAKSVIGLLSVADGNASVTRKHALKVKNNFIKLFSLKFNPFRIDRVYTGRMEFH